MRIADEMAKNDYERAMQDLQRFRLAMDDAASKVVQEQLAYMEAFRVALSKVTIPTIVWPSASVREP